MNGLNYLKTRGKVTRNRLLSMIAQLNSGLLEHGSKT